MELYLRFLFAQRWAFAPSLAASFALSFVLSGSYYIAAAFALFGYLIYRMLPMLNPQSFFCRKMFGVYDAIAISIITYGLAPFGTLFWILGMILWIVIDIKVGSQYR